MPEQPPDLHEAAQTVLSAAFFENWLRFYFIYEKDDEEPLLKIPPHEMRAIKNLYPLLAPIAQALNEKAITFSRSREAILDFALARLARVPDAGVTIKKVLCDPRFQTRLEAFQAWLQLHALQLDQGFLDFSEWLRLFEEWNERRSRRLQHPENS